MKLFNFFLILLLITISNNNAMQQPAASSSQQPSKQTVDNETLWKQFKARLQVMGELKKKTKEKSQKQLTQPPAPATFRSQTEVFLTSFFGPGKTLDEYITQAMNYTKPDDPQRTQQYLAALKPLEPLFNHLARQIIETEKKYWDYFVFYHGQSSSLTIIHDIMKEIYGWLNIETPQEQTQFFRSFAQKKEEYKNINEVLKAAGQVMQKVYPDRDPFLQKFLLATNLSLFGHLGESAESTWMYFVEGASAKPPSLADEITQFFKLFGFNEKFVHLLIAAHSNYLLQREFKGNLYQLFIHPSVIDEISYLSRRGGEEQFPFTKWEVPTIVGINSEETKKRLEQLEKRVYDPKLGRHSVLQFLNLWRTDPELILFVRTQPRPDLAEERKKVYLRVSYANAAEIMNEIQARIYLKYSVLMDPEKVKIITYKTPSTDPMRAQKADEQYKKQLQSIIEEMMKEWFLSAQKQGEKSRAERLIDFLRQR